MTSLSAPVGSFNGLHGQFLHAVTRHDTFAERTKVLRDFSSLLGGEGGQGFWRRHAVLRAYDRVSGRIRGGERDERCGPG